MMSVSGRKDMETNNQKRIIAFTKDEVMLSVLIESSSEGMVSVYPYNANLSEINFDNSVILLDYDVEDFNVTAMLPILVKKAGMENEVIIVSKNCDRKNVVDCAKKGVARFIVKPLNKKRFKKFVLPYLTISTCGTTETTNSTL
jgi:response regulator of citrate/malate metabolism